MDVEEPPTPDDAPIWGAVKIGAAVGLKPRSAFRLLEKGVLPGNKIGKLWCSTRRRLLQRVLGDDGYVAPKPEPEPPPPLAKSRKRKLKRKAKG